MVSSNDGGSYIGSCGYSNSVFSGVGLSNLSNWMLSFATINDLAVLNHFSHAMFGWGPLSQKSVTPIGDFVIADCALWLTQRSN